MGTEQHKREGRLERALREHLTAHPDETFSTDDLCGVCYRAPVARKHRVAVLRAMDKVMAGKPDWRSTWSRNVRGNMLVFFNAASVPSTAKAKVKWSDHNWWPHEVPRWDESERLTEAERQVAEHTIMRDGTPEERERLIQRREAERSLSAAKISLATAVAKNPMGVLLNSSRVASGNMKELADKARALMIENDPDAIREGLAEIAAALDGMAREAEDPMARVQEMLA